MAHTSVVHRKVEEYVGVSPGMTATLRVKPHSISLRIEKDRGPGTELTGSAVRILYELLELANGEQRLK